ncbi:MAG: hypothetical protein ACJ73E_13485 [Mycobacteriales bacterium]
MTEDSLRAAPTEQSLREAPAELSRREPPAKESASLPWSAVGMMTIVLVAGAFVTGWHFGRRWGRMVGW